MAKKVSNFNLNLKDDLFKNMLQLITQSDRLPTMSIQPPSNENSQVKIENLFNFPDFNLIEESKGGPLVEEGEVWEQPAVKIFD